MCLRTFRGIPAISGVLHASTRKYNLSAISLWNWNEDSDIEAVYKYLEVSDWESSDLNHRENAA